MATVTSAVEKSRVKAIAHETRAEALIVLMRAEENESEVRAELKVKALQQGKSEAEIETMLEGFSFNGKPGGLSPKALAVLCAEGLEERRNGRARKDSKHDPNLSSVSYHVKELCKRFGLIKLVKEIPRRGAVEHLYRIDPKHRERVRKLTQFVQD